MIIDRNIINPDIDYEGRYNREHIGVWINRWKHLLIDRGAKKGDTVALAIMSINLHHIACIFAVAELGLRLFLFSKPLCKETISATKMALFGPMDFTIIEEFMWEEPNHEEMFTKYGGKLIFQQEIHNCKTATDIQPWEVYPHNDFLFASTSGSTTGDPKPVIVSHKDFLETAKRNAKVFDFRKESVHLHSINMHHASAMISSLIPALMTSDKHYFGMLTERNIPGVKTFHPVSYTKYIIEKKITNCIIAWPASVDLLISILKLHDRPEQKLLPEDWKDTMQTLRIQVCGFTVPESFYKYAKELPVEFWSHYGAVDVCWGGPVILNVVDKNAEYSPQYIGKQCDDFFVPEITEDGVFVTSHLWAGRKKLGDVLDKVDDRYYHRGRADISERTLKWNDEIEFLLKEQHGDFTALYFNKKQSALVLWDADKHYNFDAITAPIHKMVKHIVYLKKQDFVVDTKIDITQLKAYLEHHYGEV